MTKIKFSELSALQKINFIFCIIVSTWFIFGTGVSKEFSLERLQKSFSRIPGDIQTTWDLYFPSETPSKRKPAMRI